MTPGMRAVVSTGARAGEQPVLAEQVVDVAGQPYPAPVQEHEVVP
jgi:hypothetical protein